MSKDPSSEELMLQAALAGVGCFEEMTEEEQQEVWLSLERLGLVDLNGDMVRLTEKGLRFGRQLAAASKTPPSTEEH